MTKTKPAEAHVKEDDTAVRQLLSDPATLSSRLRLITDAIPALVSYVDRDQVYQFNNRAYAEWFGTSVEELRGRHIRTVVGEAAYAKIKPFIERVLSGLAVRFQQEVDYRGAGTRIIDASYVPDISADGHVNGFVALVNDITESARAEEVMRDREQRFEAMIDAIPTAVYTTDAQGKVTHYNPAAAALAGREPVIGADEWCISWKIYKIDGSPLLREQSPMAIALREGRPVVGEEIIIERPDGKRAIVAVFPTPLFDEDGTLVGGINVLVDQTERRLAESALERRAREQAALYEFTDRRQRASSLPEVFEVALDAITRAVGCDRAAILLFDAQGTMRFVASRGLSLTYKTAVEGHSPWPPGQTHVQPVVIPDAQHSFLSSDLKKVVREEGISSMSFIPLEGQRLLGKFMLYFNEPHDFQDHEIELAMTIGRQLAYGIERRRTEDRLAATVEALQESEARLESRVEERTDQLVEANEQLQSFTYSVAHDFRQQIRGVSLNASMALEEAGTHASPLLIEKLERLVWSAKQMAALTDDLLEYARVGKTTLRPASIDLGEIAESVAMELAVHRGGDLEFEMWIEQGMVARADPSLLRLVFENLIDNSLKYSRNSPLPLVYVGKDERGFYVRDNGVGFDPRYKEKLFRPFERLHLDTEFEGTGIGLANVKRAIELHGGSVWAQSEPGEGATFGFSLPADS